MDSLEKNGGKFESEAFLLGHAVQRNLMDVYFVYPGKTHSAYSSTVPLLVPPSLRNGDREVGGKNPDFFASISVKFAWEKILLFSVVRKEFGIKKKASFSTTAALSLFVRRKEKSPPFHVFCSRLKV